MLKISPHDPDPKHNPKIQIRKIQGQRSIYRNFEWLVCHSIQNTLFPSNFVSLNVSPSRAIIGGSEFKPLNLEGSAGERNKKEKNLGLRERKLKGRISKGSGNLRIWARRKLKGIRYQEIQFWNRPAETKPMRTKSRWGEFDTTNIYENRNHPNRFTSHKNSTW